jgi:hypothetical protein
MISTSGILSTGLKKCRPMKRAAASVPSRPLARSVIGSVEVFEHSSAPSARNGVISLKTFCFRATSSKTA